MSGVNQIMIVGHVGAAPQLSYGQNEQPYCRFAVAVNEQWKADGEKCERVTWFPVVAFNGISEACANYLDRGRMVAVQGRVQMREFEDRAGTKCQIMQIMADRVTFLNASRQEDQESRRPTPGKPAASRPGAKDDVPF